MRKILLAAVAVGTMTLALPTSAQPAHIAGLAGLDVRGPTPREVQAGRERCGCEDPLMFKQPGGKWQAMLPADATRYRAAMRRWLEAGPSSTESKYNSGGIDGMGSVGDPVNN